jgi:acetyl esterase
VSEREAPQTVNVHPALRSLLDGDGASPITDIAAARVQRRKAARERAGSAPAVRSVVDVADGRLRLYEPMDRKATGALVVVHSGGFVWGGIDEVDVLARALANATGRLTVAVGYRLAPEHPYPAPLDDVSAALTWLMRNASQLCVDRSDVVLLGLSAGGNLALAASTRLRGTAHAVAAQILVYPMLDPTLSSESAHRYATVPPLSRQRAGWFWDQYTAGAAPTEPGAAPVLNPDPSGLPPTYLVLADIDVLRDEGLAYAQRLRSVSVPADTTVWPGTVHGFLNMAGLVPELCAAAVNDIADWIAARSARSGPPG